MNLWEIEQLQVLWSKNRLGMFIEKKEQGDM